MTLNRMGVTTKSKPVLVILTSRDEKGECSLRIAEAVRAIGTHNVVILSDTQYAYGGKEKKADRFYDDAMEIYRDFLEKRGKIFAGGRKGGKLSGRVNRIKNAVLRFKPEAIVCVTPYAHYAASEAKYKANFHTPIIDVVMSFAADSNVYNEETDAFIVDNSDIKTVLVKAGAKPKDVLVMGLPVVLKKSTPIEVEALKQDLGISRLTTFFLNVSDKNDKSQIFSLLADQGKIFNTVVYVKDAQEAQTLRKISEAKNANNIHVFTDVKETDEYITASDYIITDYDSGVIYKGFLTQKPVVCVGKANDNELDYLLSKGLIMRAKEPIDVVDDVYTLMQTDKKADLVKATSDWVEFNSIENIANYLVAYINTDED